MSRLSGEIFALLHYCLHSPSGALRAKMTPSPPTPKLRLQSLFLRKIIVIRDKVFTRVKEKLIRNFDTKEGIVENHTYLSHCSGVNDGLTLSRSSIKTKSFPKPSYLANSIMLAPPPIFADRPLFLVLEERVEKASAIGIKQRNLNTIMMRLVRLSVLGE